MREVDTDVMAGMTPNAISLRESSLLKKRERASDFCSLLTAYRLLDIISLLEATESSVRPPVQLRSKVDIPKNTVRLIVNFVHTVLIMNRNLSTISKIGRLPYRNFVAITLHDKKQPFQSILSQILELNNYMLYFNCIPVWLRTKDYSICNLPQRISRLCYNAPLKIMYDPSPFLLLFPWAIFFRN